MIRQWIERIYEKASSQWSALFAKGLEHLAVRGKLTDPYTQLGAVYKAIHAIASQGASTPWLLFDSDGDRIEEHQAIDLLWRPNEHTIGTAFWEKHLTIAENCGEVFWLLDEMAREGFERPGQVPGRIRFIPPKQMEAVTDRKTKELTGWKWNDGNIVHRLSTEEVIHFPYPHPWDPIRGLAPLTAARLSATVLWKQLKWQDQFFKHGGLPSFLIHFPKETIVGPKQKKKFKEEVLGEHTGMDNVGKPLILYKGGQAKTLSPSQKDMDWLGGIRAMEEDILGIFGVPPPFVSVLRDANYSNMREVKRYMLYNTVFPKLDLIASIVQVKLFERFWPDVFFGWDKNRKVAESIPEDIQDSIKASRQLWTMGVPASETFEVVGLDVDTEGKPWLDVGYIPSAMVPAVQEEKEEEEPDPADGEQEAAMRMMAVARTLDDDREALSLRYVPVYRAWLLDIRKEVLANLGNAAEVQEETESHIRAIDPETDVESILFRFDDAAEALTVASLPEWKRALRKGGQGVLDELEIAEAFDVTDPLALEFLATKAVKVKVDGQIVHRIHERIRHVVEKGIQEKQTVQEVKDQVREVFNGERRNALDIARTEMGQSYNGGRYQGMIQARAEGHRWVTANDDAVRDSHARNQAHGPVRIGQRFPNGLLYPLDVSSNKPEEIVNCRCNTFAVMKMET